MRDDDDVPTYDGGVAEDWERRTRVHGPRVPILEYPEDLDETGFAFTVRRTSLPASPPNRASNGRSFANGRLFTARMYSPSLTIEPGSSRGERTRSA